MSDVVEYIVRMKDELSPKLSGIQSLVQGIGVALAGVFAVQQVAQFAAESVKAFTESEKAAAQLKATLASTGGGIGVTIDQLIEQAKELQKTTLFEDDSIIQMDSVLATFTAIKGAIATEAIPAILDLSAKMGQDLQTSAVQVGKALNDPINGISALRRVGVSFTDSQEAVIKKLSETGHVAEAQAMILKELNTEFGGSARAAYDAASPMEKLNNKIADMYENFGALFVKIQVALAPAFERVIDLLNKLSAGLENAVAWAKENHTYIEALGVAVVAAAGAYGIYIVVTQAVVAWETLKYMWMMRSVIATTLLTTVQAALNIVMTANPVGLVVVAIAALAAGIYIAYQKSEQFRAVMAGLFSVIKNDFYPILKAYGELWLGIITFSPETFKNGVAQMGDAIKNLANIKQDFNLGYNESLKESAASKAAEVAKAGKTTVKSPVKTATVTPLAGSKETVVTGSKSLNIKIDIREMIGVKTFTSTGSEAMDIKTFGQKVLQVMTTAINDAQIITE